MPESRTLLPGLFKANIFTITDFDETPQWHQKEKHLNPRCHESVMECGAVTMGGMPRYVTLWHLLRVQKCRESLSKWDTRSQNKKWVQIQRQREEEVKNMCRYNRRDDESQLTGNKTVVIGNEPEPTGHEPDVTPSDRNWTRSNRKLNMLKIVERYICPKFTHEFSSKVTLQIRNSRKSFKN